MYQEFPAFSSIEIHKDLHEQGVGKKNNDPAADQEPGISQQATAYFHDQDTDLADGHQDQGPRIQDREKGIKHLGAR